MYSWTHIPVMQASIEYPLDNELRTLVYYSLQRGDVIYVRQIN